ncbi:unnamed protein product [Effrenium voratum]|uniref:ATP-grasp domain-containing protein n=1 Tax=Effrenium voratum TaxID=2562239 RepID=A0AA36NAT8_9DINO|nr:unnamed protein product [Effrenium voratum]CAJ1458573.1 unnamed protein product [Effrenium voratum]
MWDDSMEAVPDFQGPYPAGDAASSQVAPKVLCCIWGELRGVLATLDSLRAMLLEPLSADLLAVAQRQLLDDEQRLTALSSSRLVGAKLYEKPSPETFFGEHYEYMSQVRGNWLNAGNTQVLINHKMLADYLRSQNMYEKYDLFVFTRSDLLHLLPFPGAADLRRCLGRTDVLTQAGHEFGGVNYNFAIMQSAVAEQYLTAPYDTIVSRSLPNRQKVYNIELFWRVILAQKSIRNLRMPVTCFVTGESVEDRTSWRKIRHSEEHDVIYKYQAQMEEAFRNLEIWKQHPEWTVLRPPLGLQVTEVHGQARRLFGLHFAAEVPDRSVASKAEGSEELEETVRFHCVPKKGWDRYFRGMHCQACNTINWKGSGGLPQPPQSGCWLLPTSDVAATAVAQQQEALKALGWRVVSSTPEVLKSLGNKVGLQDFAKANGLMDFLPRRYASAECAEFPCILKKAYGEFGKECCIVNSTEEVHQVAKEGLGSQWVLQELIRGRCEVSTTVLVDCGVILDEVSTCYEYDSEVYVWPRCRRISKHVHHVPDDHLQIFQLFLQDYRGICNFNYKVCDSGQLSIFELNTRIGGDLAVDAPRDRAKRLFEKLDEHFHCP